MNVIFDFDGTIADSIPVIVSVMNTLAPRYGFEPVGQKEFELLRKYGIRELIKQFNIPFYKVPFLVSAVTGEVGKKISSMELCSGMPELLEALNKQGFRMGIVSSSPQANIMEFLEGHRLGMFGFVHSQLNLFGKAGAIEAVMRKYNLVPADTVYVGDERRDVEACASIGLDMVAVTWGFNNEEGLREQGAARIARHPSDILGYLKTI